MAENSSSQSTQSSSSKKIRSSRVLTFSLVVIIILAILYLVSIVVIAKLSKLVTENPTKEVIDLVTTLSALIKIDVTTAIGTIATACVARYGLREVSSNLVTVTTKEESK